MENDIADLYPWLLRQARRYYRDKMDAEDLAGDTIYKLLMNKERFNEGKSLKPWGVAIMQNTFITEYNRRQLVRFTLADERFSIASAGKASDLLELDEAIRVINRCRHRSCCIECAIYYARGYSYDEISEILGIPVGTVRSRISSARSLIKKELGFKS